MATHVPPAETIAPGSAAAWLVALRPRTFPIAIVPVVVGAAIAWSRHGGFDARLALLALAGALLAQALTNLQNDVGFTLRRAETGARTGLPRATANGWLAIASVRWAILGAVVLGALVAAALAAVRGPIVYAIAGASLVAAWAYMGGPRPIAWTPLGELAVLAFFGVTAVAGTVFVLAGRVDAVGWLAGVALGLLAAAVLTVNNHRDLAHDASIGRRTLSVRLGPAGSRALYRAQLVAAFALVPAIAVVAGSARYLLPLAIAPAAAGTWRAFAASPGGHGLTAVLLRTVRLELWFGLLLAAGSLAAGS